MKNRTGVQLGTLGTVLVSVLVYLIWTLALQTGPEAVDCVLDPCGGGRALLPSDETALELTVLVEDALRPFGLRETEEPLVVDYRDSRHFTANYRSTAGSDEFPIRIELSVHGSAAKAMGWLETSAGILLNDLSGIKWKQRTLTVSLEDGRAYETEFSRPWMSSAVYFSHGLYVVEVKVQHYDVNAASDLADRIAVALVNQLPTSD